MEFYKNNQLIWSYAIVFVLVFVIFLLAFILTGLYLVLWLLLGLYAMWGFCFATLWKSLFQKVKVDREGIVVYYKNEILQSMKWEEVVVVKRNVDYESSNFTFYGENDKQIQFNITRKRAQMVKEICPREEIKEQIDNIHFPFSKKKPSTTNTQIEEKPIDLQGEKSTIIHPKSATFIIANIILTLFGLFAVAGIVLGIIERQWLFDVFGVILLAMMILALVVQLKTKIILYESCIYGTSTVYLGESKSRTIKYADIEKVSYSVSIVSFIVVKCHNNVVPIKLHVTQFSKKQIQSIVKELESKIITNEKEKESIE